METKELKIQVPEGYEIDKENSTFECIKFKPIKKCLTYDDVAKELFKGRNKYIHAFSASDGWKESVCTSDKQVEKLLAINKLMNVAKYLNVKEKRRDDGIMYCIKNNRGILMPEWKIPKDLNFGEIFLIHTNL